MVLTPPAKGSELDDGRLTASEVAQLKLNAALVILSACNTASGDRSGAEAISGLGKAFFYAGTKSLVVSHWPVHSQATAELMKNIFKNKDEMSELDWSESIRQARVQLLDNDYFEVEGKKLFRYAHPIFWAPFSFVGVGG